MKHLSLASDFVVMLSHSSSCCTPVKGAVLGEPPHSGIGFCCDVEPLHFMLSVKRALPGETLLSGFFCFVLEPFFRYVFQLFDSCTNALSTVSVLVCLCDLNRLCVRVYHAYFGGGGEERGWK